MQITYLVIISLITYILGAFNKLKWTKIPNKYIPLQNVFIGLISGFICYFFKVETNLLNSLVLCLSATMSAGGIADLTKMKD